VRCCRVANERHGEWQQRRCLLRAGGGTGATAGGAGLATGETDDEIDPGLADTGERRWSGWRRRRRRHNSTGRDEALQLDSPNTPWSRAENPIRLGGAAVGHGDETNSTNKSTKIHSDF
jgi:hypothetical protein